MSVDAQEPSTEVNLWRVDSENLGALIPLHQLRNHAVGRESGEQND